MPQYAQNQNAIDIPNAARGETSYTTCIVDHTIY